MNASQPACVSDELNAAFRTVSPMASLQIAPDFVHRVVSPAYPYKGIRWSICAMMHDGRIYAGVKLSVPPCIRSANVRCAISSIVCDRRVEPVVGWIYQATLTPADTDVVRYTTQYHFTPDQARRCSCGRFHVDLRVISVTKEQDSDAMLTEIWDKQCNNNDFLRGELKEAHEATAGEKRKADALKEENQVLQAKIKSLEEEAASKAKSVIDLSKDDDKEGDEPKSKRQKTEAIETTGFGRLLRMANDYADEIHLVRQSEEVLKMTADELKTALDPLYAAHRRGSHSMLHDLEFSKRTREKEDKIKAEAMQCRVCLNKPRCMLILPCNHLAICEECSVQLAAAAASPQCPMCRGPIDKTQKVYVS
jgi:hypothetical protein